MREDMDTEAGINYVACKVSEVAVGIISSGWTYVY